jgi:cytochrome c biogenesis protein CcmG, thiol:disulfide interchange protein DsbE
MLTPGPARARVAFPYPWRPVKRSAAPLIAALTAAALVALLVYGVVARGGGSSLDDAVSRGERPAAPGLQRRLPTLGRPGNRHALADYRGKVVVLNFWASWCDPCHEEAPLLEAAHRRLTRDGAGTVVGVTYLDTPNDSARFVRKFGLTFVNLRDVNTELARGFGTRSLPETFVLDRRGHVVAISRGQIAERFLDRALREALQ